MAFYSHYFITPKLKIVNHWHKGDNGVTCAVKEIKFGLELGGLLSIETEVATHACGLTRAQHELFAVGNFINKIPIKSLVLD